MARGAASRRDDSGFTLVELIVVVLIIAILIAIAIPTFLGARQTANDRATEANVRSAFVATRIYYNDKMSYTDDPVAMQAVEPALTWTTTPLDDTSPDRAIFIKMFDGGRTVIVVGRTRNNRCFYLKDDIGGSGAGTFYDVRLPSASTTCPVPDPADVTWQGSWSS
jgi:type IV pilus assembly protein PilA